MKRFVLLAMCILTGMVCNAQLRPPIQTDTLVIKGVKYNYAEIRKENWPCSVIYKSTTMFSIGDSKFKILDVEQKGLFGQIYFTLTDLLYTDNSKYTLIYDENEYDGVIRIWFSDYEFTCKSFRLHLIVLKLELMRMQLANNYLRIHQRKITVNLQTPLTQLT